MFKRDFYKQIDYKRVAIVVGLGQFVSLCISGTGVANRILSNDYNFNIPISQNLFMYILLALIYLPYTLYKNGRNTLRYLKKAWYWYILFALADVEGNFFLVKAYEYTNLLSVALLDTFTLPCVLVLSMIFMKVRYKLIHYASVVICLAGIGIMVKLDTDAGGPGIGKNPLLGDFFVIIGCICYSVSNVLQEYIVKIRPVYETIALIGTFGTIINGIQILIFELKPLRDTQFTGPVVGYLFLYLVSMVCLYSTVPILMRLSSALFFNLSVLTSDVYILLLSLFIFKIGIVPLYAIPFILTVSGLILFNLTPPKTSETITALPGITK